MNKTHNAEVPAANVAGTSVASDAPSTLKLEPHCTLRESIALKTSLLEQLELGCDVVIDGSAVERIDTAGLQLLAAFSRQMQESDRHLSWQGETAELMQVAARLDLANLIGLNAAAVQS